MLHAWAQLTSALSVRPMAKGPISWAVTQHATRRTPPLPFFYTNQTGLAVTQRLCKLPSQVAEKVVCVLLAPADGDRRLNLCDFSPGGAGWAQTFRQAPPGQQW